MKTDVSFFERVVEFKYLRKPVTIKILFRKKLKADWSQEMVAIILCRNFCFPVCYPKIQRLRYTEPSFYLLFCMGVQLGRSQWRRNVGWGLLRIGCWGEYLGLRRMRLTGEWSKLHNEVLNDLYASPNTVRVIKSRRMKWARYVARMGRGELYTGFWSGNPWERDHLEDPGVNGRKIRRWIFRDCDVEEWTGSIWQGQVEGTGEWGNEPPGFHTMWGICWPAENKSDSQEGLCYIE